ncbi:ASPIC and UnbV [Posidoniimonas polymericola]|uniref:ASPIC and UnbV n=1 Tax=Posidoniimonas polymericola TaxID=2528002 RepID=A0A5C5YLF9_9BACT|nr:CRTAC1 family protein [Posidoniimonas polymericola]TWT75724.1 ASPIC and UnbV [Posidoniimonas polymericola]
MKSQHELDPGAPSEADEQSDAAIAVALKRSLLVLSVAAAAVLVAVFLGNRTEPVVVTESELSTVEVREAPMVDPPSVRFTDISGQLGQGFVHRNAAEGDKLLPETMGGGCAFLDFDNDGDQDLLLVNSLSHWPWDDAPQAEPSAGGALFANDGAGRFSDVTAGSGLEQPLYGMGVAVGDYDNDGLVDVFLSAVGRDRLLHNEGGGKFRDVTDEAGVSGGGRDWGTGCGWCDYDNDGDLDLFVCNYLNWSREFDAAQDFQLVGGGRAYGRPQNFEGVFPFLYRNDGDGRFTEVAESAGLQVRNAATNVPVAKSLGVTFVDADEDGWIDVIVANDTVQNFLFHNMQDGTFREVAIDAGIAFDMNGAARGAMGIDVARFRDNGALGIAIGNFSNEMTALYVSYKGEMQFMDEAVSTGLGPNSRLELSFGLFFFDCDLDGRLDIFTANGHLEEEINRVQPSQHYEQSPHLFWNCGAEHDTEFVTIGASSAGEDLLRPMVGRGAAFADIDSDGDLDLVITAIGGAARLVRNDQELENDWIRFRLTGSTSNRDAIGAWIRIDLEDRTIERQVMPTRSYLSQVELPVTIGLGRDAKVKSMSVQWPDGAPQVVPFDGVNQLYDVRQLPASGG